MVDPVIEVDLVDLELDIVPVDVIVSFDDLDDLVDVEPDEFLVDVDFALLWRGLEMPSSL